MNSTMNIAPPIPISIVVPAWNEEQTIGEVLLSIRGMTDDLVVVDGHSTDRTVEIALAYDARVVQENARGKGNAVRIGLTAVRHPITVFIDADGSHEPADIPRLVAPIRVGEADLVIGSRMAGSESQMPKSRRLGNLFFARLVSLIGNHRISDSASGMRIIRRDVLPRLYPLPDGLNFTPVMSTRAIHEELRMIEVPIPYAERLGRSKLTIVGDGTRFLQSIVWTAFQYNPVRVLGSFGIALVAMAFLIGLALLLLRLQGITELGTWGTFAVFAAQVLAVSAI